MHQHFFALFSWMEDYFSLYISSLRIFEKSLKISSRSRGISVSSHPYLLLLLCWSIICSGFFDEQSSEEQHLSEIEIFCNIINVFIITFDQFEASLLNKSINFYTLFSKYNAFEGYNVTNAFYFR